MQLHRSIKHLELLSRSSFSSPSPLCHSLVFVPLKCKTPLFDKQSSPTPNQYVTPQSNAIDMKINASRKITTGQKKEKKNNAMPSVYTVLFAGERGKRRAGKSKIKGEREENALPSVLCSRVQSVRFTNWRKGSERQKRPATARLEQTRACYRRNPRHRS